MFLVWGFVFVGVCLFVGFFSHSSFGNQTSAGEEVCWDAVPEGISSRMQTGVTKGPSQQGGWRGWSAHLAQVGHSWTGHWVSVHSLGIQEGKGIGKGNWESRAEPRLPLLPSPRQTITASLTLRNAKYRPHNTWSVPLPLLPPPPPSPLRAGMAHALSES